MSQVVKDGSEQDIYQDEGKTMTIVGTAYVLRYESRATIL